MATPDTALHLSGLAQRLVRETLLAENAARDFQQRAAQGGGSFFGEVIKSGTIDSARLARSASEEFGIPLLDLDSMDFEQLPLEAVDEKIVRKHAILPLYQRGTRLFVAVADPTNTRALDDIKFHTGMGVEPVLVDAQVLGLGLDRAYESRENEAFEDLADQGLEDIDISGEEEAADQKAAADIENIDTPVVRFVNKMLLDAINRSASDIHMEPYEKKYRIRYRVDGVLHEIASPPLALAARLCARVKILSRLDIAERRVPQDGRMKMRLSKTRSIDFRVSTLPTLYGEKVVIRVLDTSGASVGLESLGMNPAQKKLYMDAIERPYGMILVTGPTGSGKTVSLYSALGVLNTVDRNICTVEDPVEINLVGINQVSINERAGVSFALVLRAFLRQDPDVVMVGEIRDLETADIAIKASQTGHLVLSTLHTNDAPSTLTRLLNMGVAPFNIASAVHLIMAQRLLRRLCTSCRQPAEIPEPALLQAGFGEEELERLTVYRPVGCSQCTNGYRGRTGVFQVMPVSEAMDHLMMEGCNELDIEQQAREEGIIDLRRAGLDKVAEGITSLEEIERITNV
ncbi:MAG: type IV-A pilus assembly ATPase PilB [Gammaproteobacteria bacterium]|jgi:type IV pilus assembly protein PilB|nr:type IV-A pilus assembly ATPase PilB [Gammaproteobacteria bacterium]